MKNTLALAAVAIASTSLVVAWIGSPPAAAPPAPAADVDLTPVLARVAALEQALAELPRAVERPAAELPVRQEAGISRDETIEVLTKRIERLEKRLAEEQIKRFAPGGDANPQQVARIPGKPGIDDSVQLALDLAKTEEQRLEGLRALRFQKLPDGTDARLAVLDEMIRLAQTSTEAKTRADVWRQMSHVTDARLKGPLLDALALDPDSDVREEAAETLADFMPDRAVEVALRNAGEHDADAGVRRQALQSLAGKR